MKSRRRLSVIAWGTVALYVLIAVCMTHMPKPPSELNKISDKSLHMMGYAMYAAVLYVACIVTWPRVSGFPLYVVLALALWAGVDEITQPYFGRDCDILDWRADMIGALVAIVLLSSIRFIAMKRFPQPA